MSEKKYLVIDRPKCIGCGSCVMASDGKCNFVEGKAWASKVIFREPNDVIDVCPVDAISAADEQEYDAAKAKYNLK